MKAKVKCTSEEELAAAADELLVDEVLKYPALYDVGSEAFKNVQEKHNAWAKIAATLS